MDLSRIDLNLLTAFDALMAERHVTRAAKRIGISQPAMSAALARLRRLTNDELLTRSAGGLAPTPVAADLMGPVHEALVLVADALGVDRRFDAGTAQRIFSIAMADLPAQLLACALTTQLMQEAPACDLRLRSFRDRYDAITLLDDGKVDVAIGVSPGQEARILHAPLFDQRFVGVSAASAHNPTPFADLDAFCAAGHLLVSPEADDYGAVDAALRRMGLSRRIVTSVAAMHLAPEIIIKTGLVAALPEALVAASAFRKQLCVFQLPVSIEPVTFHLLWHRRSDEHPAHRWLREQIFESAGLLVS